MRKYARKFLAFFVSFVMAVVMVPMNGFNSYAADTTVTVITYQKVTSRDNLDSTKEYVIYSKGYALANNNGSISAEEVTLTGENPTVPDSAIWKISKISDKNYNISNNKQYLNINDTLSLGDSQNLKINSSASRISYSDYYLNFDNTSWTVSTSKSDVKIYEKVTTTKVIKDLTPDTKIYEDDAAVGSEYPAPGFVKINKQATSSDFNGTGVAEVELSTTGVPMRKGADIVLILDVSSSMTFNMAGESGTRIQHTKKAAEDFVNKVLGNNADGTKSNNRLALVTFAGRNGNTYVGTDGYGNEILNTFKNANSKDDIITTIENIQTKQGTDYDYAFNAASKLLGYADTKRDKYIVFMTDGEPYYYNEKGFEQIEYNASTHYVEPHTISTNLKNNTDKLKIYSVGFCGINSAKAEDILKGISSGDGYYINATNSTALNDAFDKIATSIKKAGTDAVVTDVIGNSYNLQTTKTLPKNATQTENPKLSYDPTIEVNLYDLYTWADLNNGTITDRNDIGKRKSTTPINVEKVTFNSTGTEAYSNLIKDESGNFNNIMTVNGNITTIAAKNFTYTKTKNDDGTDSEVITWNVGDITEQEATISYSVYLKDSLEGGRGNGLYPTNESAVLNYKDYLGNSAHKDYRKPTMPWGAAVVNYEFYLVNDKGQPVNSNNEPISFENRVLIGKTEQKEFNWNNKTSLEASIEANKLVPDGYELYIKDTVYTANASSSGNGSCTIAEHVPDGSLGAGKNGSSTKVYNYDAGYTNSSVAFGVINKTTLIPDTIVLDYGKSIDIDVIKNDRVVNAKLDSIAPINTELKYTQKDGVTREIALGTDYTGSRLQGFEENSQPKKSISTEQATIKVDNNVITYTPTKYMDQVDKFYYCASDVTPDGKGNDITSYRYQTVKVIPATTVYYEDNFGNTTDTNTSNGIVFSGAWAETDETDGTTSEDKQDNKDVYDKDGHQYGSDDSYTNDTKLSNGSAKVTKGDGTGEASATFTFKGTGFDLIGRTNNTTGLVQYEIYKGDKVEGDPAVIRNINTVYLDEGGDLYQIPVISWKTSEYGTYTVKITATKDVIFYLDAIRIYNPVMNDETANAQYQKDNEANAIIKKVRRLLIKSGDFNEEAITSGAVFVETVGETSTILDYTNKGPNNEVYLKKGQSVAFKIKSDKKPKSVQIGAKAPNGTSNIVVGSGLDDSKISLTSATDMYYNVTSNINWITNDDNSVYGTVIITNNSKEDTIASITNLKLTYENTGQDYDVYVDKDTTNQVNKVAVRRMSLSSTGSESGDSSQEEESSTGSESGGSSQEGEDSTGGESGESSQDSQNSIVKFIKDFFNKLFGW